MLVYTGTIGRSFCGRSVMIGQVMLWSMRSSLLKARSKLLYRRENTASREPGAENNQQEARDGGKAEWFIEHQNS